jgi:hypothetical protein
LWEKANSIPSQYPGTCDDCIYDRLVERFGAHPPPGGVVGVVWLYPPNLRFMRQALGYDMRAHSWSNLADCCDAVGNVQAFKTTCVTLQGVAPRPSTPRRHAQALIPLEAELHA